MTMWDVEGERGLDSVSLNVSARTWCGGTQRFPLGEGQRRVQSWEQGAFLRCPLRGPSDHREDVAEVQGVSKATELGPSQQGAPSSPEGTKTASPECHHCGCLMAQDRGRGSESLDGGQRKL